MQVAATTLSGGWSTLINQSAPCYARARAPEIKQHAEAAAVADPFCRLRWAEPRQASD
jgi:hypothetical protein